MSSSDAPVGAGYPASAARGAGRAAASIRATVLSLPNVLTYGRVAAAPAIVFALAFDNRGLRWTAFAIYVAACVTDWFDGWLARRWNQQSRLGQMLDPIADKLLIAAAMMVLAAKGDLAGLTLYAAIIILSREILVSGLREYLGAVQVSLPVSRLAKWKTTVQMLAIGFLIAGPAGDETVGYVSQIGSVGLIVAAALTIYTGWDYWAAGLRHIVTEDRDQG